MQLALLYKIRFYRFLTSIPPLPQQFDHNRSGKKGDFFAYLLAYWTLGLDMPPGQFLIYFRKKCWSIRGLFGPREVVPTRNMPMVPPFRLFFVTFLGFGVGVMLILAFLVNIWRNPQHFLLRKKARKINLSFSRTLRKRVPKRPKKPIFSLKKRSSVLRPPFWSEGLSPKEKNTAREDPMKNCLWVLPKTGNNSPPSGQFCPITGGNYFYSPLRSSFSPPASHSRDADKNGEMPMSPPNRAPDPPQLLVRLPTREPPSLPRETGGGGVKWSAEGLCFFFGEWWDPRCTKNISANQWQRMCK